MDYLTEHLWGIVEHFYTTLQLFEEEHVAYEERIKTFSKEKKISQDKLIKSLDSKETQSLLNYKKLSKILHDDLQSLKEMCSIYLKINVSNNLFHYYISDIFHEFSILEDEYNKLHLNSIFDCDTEECKSILEEVHIFLPLKMLHLLHLFKKGKKELESLLVHHNKNKILVRSIYLFGEEVIAPSYKKNLQQFLTIIYPQGGSYEGFLRASQSFYNSKFEQLAKEAFARAVSVKKIESLEDQSLNQFYHLMTGNCAK